MLILPEFLTRMTVLLHFFCIFFQVLSTVELDITCDFTGRKKCLETCSKWLESHVWCSHFAIRKHTYGWCHRVNLCFFNSVYWIHQVIDVWIYCKRRSREVVSVALLSHWIIFYYQMAKQLQTWERFRQEDVSVCDTPNHCHSSSKAKLC